MEERKAEVKVELAGTAGSLDIKHGNAGVNQVEREASQSRQVQRAENKRVEKP